MTILQIPDGEMLFVVTVKLAKNPAHNPRDKQQGECPCATLCTDTTGEHHSFLMYGPSVEQVTTSAKVVYGHVTRVEIAKIWSYWHRL